MRSLHSILPRPYPRLPQEAGWQPEGQCTTRLQPPPAVTTHRCLLPSSLLTLQCLQLNVMRALLSRRCVGLAKNVQPAAEFLGNNVQGRIGCEHKREGSKCVANYTAVCVLCIAFICSLCWADVCVCNVSLLRRILPLGVLQSPVCGTGILKRFTFGAAHGKHTPSPPSLAPKASPPRALLPQSTTH